MFARNGVRRLSSSKSSRPSLTPIRRAMAIRCTIALVDPPIANTVVIELRNAVRVRMSDSLTSSQTISTIRRPVCAAITECREYAAGIEDAPGRVPPSASTALVMVDAVPMVMQCPADRAIPPSTPFHSCWVINPARRSAQYFQVSDPEPSTFPAKFPRSIGPAGINNAGRSIDSAPISKPGTVLSHPPISTAPSIGYDRSNSSVSIANKFRYSIVVGFWNGSDNDIAGISNGNPPDDHTPRLTSSTRCLKCVWQGLISLQVLMMPMT